MYLARVFDARGVLANYACGQRVSALIFCRWGVVWGVGFVCLAFDVVGRLVVSPGLEARRTRLAPRPSRGNTFSTIEGKCARSSGRAGCSTVGGKGSRPSRGRCSTIEGKGCSSAGSNASAASLCGRGWCSAGVDEFSSRLALPGADVVGRLVVSPGLEARRTRLAPRPAREGQSVIGGRRLDQREGTPRPSGGDTTTIRMLTPRPSIRRGTRPSRGQVSRGARTGASSRR